MQRVFFALWPDADARRRLVALAQSMQRECGGRVTQERNLHMTVVFVGNATDETVKKLIRAAQDVHKQPFGVRIDRCQYWKHNRILWAGGEAPEALLRLSADLRGALDAAGAAYDGKAFAPHMTLLRDARAPQSAPAFEPIEWTARGYSLLVSEHDASGIVYRDAAVFG